MINGKNAPWIHFNMTRPLDSKIQSTEIGTYSTSRAAEFSELMFLIKKDSKSAYIVWCETLSEDFTTNKIIFEQVVRTFKFIK